MTSEHTGNRPAAASHTLMEGAETANSIASSERTTRLFVLPQWRGLGATGLLIVGAATLVLTVSQVMSAVVFAPICGTATSAEASDTPFLAENDEAMRKMMTGMTIQPTGDVDGDFVRMMIPHHQGAIEMARALLLYGRNEKLRRLAQEIIVTQQQEIVAMRMAIGEPSSPSAAVPKRALDHAVPYHRAWN